MSDTVAHGSHTHSACPTCNAETSARRDHHFNRNLPEHLWIEEEAVPLAGRLVLQKIFWPQLAELKSHLLPQYLVWDESFCNTNQYALGATFDVPS